MWFQALDFFCLLYSSHFSFWCRTRRRNLLVASGSGSPPDRSAAETKKRLAAVHETENSSAWNHIFKPQRPCPPGRRTRKMLSLWQTHGSTPRRSCLPFQILAGWKRSELEQKNESPRKKKTAADVIPVSLLSGVLTKISFFLCVSWAVYHGYSILCIRAGPAYKRSLQTDGQS